MEFGRKTPPLQYEHVDECPKIEHQPSSFRDEKQMVRSGLKMQSKQGAWIYQTPYRDEFECGVKGKGKKRQMKTEFKVNSRNMLK